MDVVKASPSAALAQTKQAIIARALIGAAFAVAAQTAAIIHWVLNLTTGSADEGRQSGCPVRPRHVAHRALPAGA